MVTNISEDIWAHTITKKFFIPARKLKLRSGCIKANKGLCLIRASRTLTISVVGFLSLSTQEYFIENKSKLHAPITHT